MSKLYFLIIACIFTFNLVIAQNKNPNPKNTSNIGLTAPDNSGNSNYTIQEWKKNKDFTVWEFHEDLALVQNVKSGKIGFIDTNGKLVIPFEYFIPNDSYFTQFSEGLAAVSSGLSEDNLDVGYIDKNGMVIIPFRYAFGNEFENGNALVFPSFGGKPFYINKQGKCVKDCP